MSDDGFATALTRAREGDPGGFDLLFRRTQPVVLRYLRTLSGPDAEDLASETWLAVVRDLRSFRGGEAQFRTWILTVARHRMLDAARARDRRPHELVACIEDDGGSDHLDPADLAWESMTTATAVQLIGTLPRDQAEAVLLRVVAGLDTTRTAALMDRSPGAVRVLTHRGLRTLRERITAVRVGEV